MSKLNQGFITMGTKEDDTKDKIDISRVDKIMSHSNDLQVSRRNHSKKIRDAIFNNEYLVIKKTDLKRRGIKEDRLTRGKGLILDKSLLSNLLILDDRQRYCLRIIANEEKDSSNFVELINCNLNNDIEMNSKKEYEKNKKRQKPQTEVVLEYDFFKNQSYTITFSAMFFGQRVTLVRKLIEIGQKWYWNRDFDFLKECENNNYRLILNYRTKNRIRFNISRKYYSCCQMLFKSRNANYCGCLNDIETYSLIASESELMVILSGIFLRISKNQESNNG